MSSPRTPLARISVKVIVVGRSVMPPSFYDEGRCKRGAPPSRNHDYLDVAKRPLTDWMLTRSLRDMRHALPAASGGIKVLLEAL